MLYRHLFAHHWKRFLRSLSVGRATNNVLTLFFGVYFGLVLLATGLLYPRLARDMGHSPLSLLHANLLTGFLGLLLARFILQRLPQLRLQPYLHLPISRRKVVYFVQAISLLSLFNTLPFLFLIPVFLKLVLPEYGAWGASAWMAGTVLLVALTHYVNVWLRTLFGRDMRRFLVAVGTLALFVLADQLMDWQSLQRGSAALSAFLLSGQAETLTALAALALATGGTAVLSSQRLRRALGTTDRSRRSPLIHLRTDFDGRRAPALNLALLELSLMLRTKRPRQVLLINGLLAIAYVPLFLSDPSTDVSAEPIIGAIAGLFATGVLAAGYGQLLFSWDSAHLDGLLARLPSLRSLVAAKLLVLQGLCLLTFLGVMPFFLWMRPGLLPLVLSFLLYSMGLASPFVLLIALWNKAPVALSKGSFLNYEGFTALHFVSALPLFAPPIAVMMFFDYPKALLLLTGAGLLGVAIFPAWCTLFARLLRHRKHVMAAGFRQ